MSTYCLHTADWGFNDIWLTRLNYHFRNQCLRLRSEEGQLSLLLSLSSYTTSDSSAVNLSGTLGPMNQIIVIRPRSTVQPWPSGPKVTGWASLEFLHTFATKLLLSNFCCSTVWQGGIQQASVVVILPKGSPAFFGAKILFTYREYSRWSPWTTWAWVMQGICIFIWPTYGSIYLNTFPTY